MLTPRAARALVGAGLLVPFQTLSLDFLTDLGKVISPIPLIIRDSKFCSAEPANETRGAWLQGHDHKGLEHKSQEVGWRAWFQEWGGPGGRGLLSVPPAFPSLPQTLSALFIFHLDKEF